MFRWLLVVEVVAVFDKMPPLWWYSRRMRCRSRNWLSRRKREGSQQLLAYAQSESTTSGQLGGVQAATRRRLHLLAPVTIAMILLGSGAGPVCRERVVTMVVTA